MHKYELAELNAGRAKAVVDDLLMDGFRTRLDEINGLAEKSPGFVWRRADDSGNATSFCMDDDPRLRINVSVWVDMESLLNFNSPEAL